MVPTLTGWLPHLRVEMEDARKTGSGLDYERRGAQPSERAKAPAPCLAGVALGALITTIAILAALISAGAGHGSYFAAKALFPYTMLTTAFGSLSPPLMAVAVAQFPAYGFFICRARSWKRRVLWAGAFAIAHFSAAIACLAYL
jgi:hypothetical protein